METQPGNNVDITIRTKPNSYVGVLGVDQSVLLLRSGNDLSLVVKLQLLILKVIIILCYW